MLRFPLQPKRSKPISAITKKIEWSLEGYDTLHINLGNNHFALLSLINTLIMEQVTKCKINKGKYDPPPKLYRIHNDVDRPSYIKKFTFFGARLLIRV